VTLPTLNYGTACHSPLQCLAGGRQGDPTFVCNVALNALHIRMPCSEVAPILISMSLKWSLLELASPSDLLRRPTRTD
jgi:hypothetical protein